ncbi:hypothetical protein PENSPDRAFT_633141 [Peniophora sp. CONT]|nr:hypothetical protein PENSPDRAFT_633141 [Peniophora sp. CONT]
MFPSDLMHWAALNFTALFLDLWLGKMKVDTKRGDDKATWAWVFLVGEIFKKHGQAVAECLPYLPGSFERPPRNPFEKINSGYKAWEYLIWFYGMAPALLHTIMPEPYYTHFCKAAAAVRILHQREATLQDLLRAYELMNEVCAEFETIYCEHKTSRLHFVRHAVHIASHMARDAIQHGMGSYLSQWVCERTIGLYTSLVRQPSNPYHNLSSQVMLQAQLHGLYARAPELDPRPSPESRIPDSGVRLPHGYVLLHTMERSKSRVSPEQRVAIADYYERIGDHLAPDWKGRVRRYNRLLLPTGQYARSAWRESVKELHKLRISRNVKMLEGDQFTFGEVLFYFRLKMNRKTRTVAMVHMYGQPNGDLMRDTYGTYYSCEQLPILERGSLVVVDYSAIQSVVAMIPQADKFFLVEKITLGAGFLGGIMEEPQPEPVDV